MNFISNLIPGNVIDAFGWTILHSIWQGAAAALGFALLMFGLRRYSSRTRYFVGVMALILVLGISLTTFFNIYETGGGSIMPNPAGASAVLSLTSQGGAQAGALSETGMASFFRTYFANHLPLIVTLWFLGILVMALRLAGGMLYNQRVKSHRTQPLAKSWQNRAQALCRRIGIQKPVRLLESALVKVPMTIGHLKPVILLPVGMVTGLPRDQVEALIAHEMAHILRKDYLVNLLQRIVDMIFFYHPGIRWISSQVRLERENCCDDIAVATCGDSLNFARALTSIGASGIGKASPALAAAGKSRALFSRVKRLFNPRRQGSQFAEGFIGACILVLFVLALVVGAHAAAGLSGNMGDPLQTLEPRSEQGVVEEAEAVESGETGVTEAAAAGAEAAAEAKTEKEKKEPAKKEKSDKEEKEEKEKLKQVQAEMARLKEELKKRAAELTKIDREELARLARVIREKTKDIKPIDPEKMKQLQAEITKMVKETQLLNKEKLAQFTAEMAKYKDEFAKINTEKLTKMSMEIAKRVKAMKPLFDKKKLAAIKAEMKKKYGDFEKLSPEEKARFEKEMQEKIEKAGVIHTEKLAKMEDQIKKMTDEFALLDKEKLAQMSAEIAKRTAELKFIDQEKLAKLEKEIQERVKNLEVLDKEKMAVLEKEIREHTKQIEFLNREKLEKFTTEMAEKAAQFAMQAQELAEQKKDLEMREQEHKKQEKELRKQEEYLDSLKEKLLKDGLITDVTDFEFKLTSKGLWVNGKEQSKKFFKKYKKMFETETGRKLEKEKTFQVVNKK